MPERHARAQVPTTSAPADGPRGHWSLSTGPIEGKAAFLESARLLRDMGVALYATHGTAAFLAEHGIAATHLHWPDEAASPNTLEFLSERRLDLVINIPKSTAEQELANDYVIRRKAADFGIPLRRSSGG